MNLFIKISTVSSLALLLCACNTFLENKSTELDVFPYSFDDIDTRVPEPPETQYEYSYNDSIPVTSDKASPRVPNTYHVGSYHGPISPKERDKNWAMQQNPTFYTIAVAESDQASVTAKELQQVPKDNRTAEISYQKQGNTRYLGLYGTFQSQAEAETALKKLPAATQEKAQIKTWRDIPS
ncbi:MAG: SPOR domain-containing protein [Legionellaceae bacterium]|nr:SPOR domain-containing protein [Legionellaceae bacterium]